MWKSDARAQTEIPPVELEAYFAKQLEASGWGRLTGSADETFAWSSWLVPNVPPAAEWRGVLLVVAPFPAGGTYQCEPSLSSRAATGAAVATRSADLSASF